MLKRFMTKIRRRRHTKYLICMKWIFPGKTNRKISNIFTTVEISLGYTRMYPGYLTETGIRNSPIIIVGNTEAYHHFSGGSA